MSIAVRKENPNFTLSPWYDAMSKPISVAKARVETGLGTLLDLSRSDLGSASLQHSTGSQSIDGMKKGYTMLRDALTPLEEGFKRTLVCDRELLGKLADDGPQGITARCEKFRDAALASRLRIDLEGISELIDLERKWNMLQVAAEETTAIMTSKGENCRYISLRAGTMVVLSIAESEAVSFIKPTVAEPLFTEQCDLSKKHQRDSMKEKLENFIEHSQMDVPLQWNHSAEETQGRHIGEVPTANGVLAPDQSGSAKMALIKSAKELIALLNRGSEYGLQEYPPRIQRRENNNQDTKDSLGIGIMLPPASSLDSQDPHLYLIHP